MIVERIHSLSPYFKSGAKVKAEKHHTFAPDAVVLEQEKNDEKKQHASGQDSPHSENRENDSRQESDPKRAPKSSNLDILA